MAGCFLDRAALLEDDDAARPESPDESRKAGMDTRSVERVVAAAAVAAADGFMQALDLDVQMTVFFRFGSSSTGDNG
jgi:hypothetical protein